MSLRYQLGLIFWGMLVTYSGGSPSPNVHVLTHDAPGSSTTNTHAAIARSLTATSFQKRNTTFSGSTSLDTDLTGPLFSIGAQTTADNITLKASVDVTCRTCYIKGHATVELDIKNNQTIGQAIDQTIREVKTDVEMLINQTETKIDTFIKDNLDSMKEFEHYLDTTWDNITENGLELSDFVPPNIDLSFQTPGLTAIPDTTLSFRFQDLDLYLELDATFNVSASYTLPLYHSNTPVGLSLPNALELGVIFTADLILSIDASLDVTGGIHVKVDEDVTLEIALFGDEVSGIDFKGGHFEFLPVTVHGASASFTAILRLGARAALEVGGGDSVADYLPKWVDEISEKMFDDDLSEDHFGGGIEVGIYANVAEFKTSMTLSEEADTRCKMAIVQDYSLVLGATAAAQVTLGTVTYGPSPNTSTAVYYTSWSTCAIQPTSSAAVATTQASNATAVLRGRQFSKSSLSTTTVTTQVTRTAMQCPPTVTGQCAVSLQTTSKVTKTLTATVTGSPDELESATYPTPIITPRPFGKNVQQLKAISGSPSSYTPTSTSAHSSGTPLASKIASKIEEEIAKHKRIAIGVGVGIGLGVPLLIALAAVALFFCLRRRKYAPVPRTEGGPPLVLLSSTRKDDTFMVTFGLAGKSLRDSGSTTTSSAAEWFRGHGATETQETDRLYQGT